MQKYDHKKIEKKWQKKWQKENLYKTSEQKGKKKCYVLDMFPYPSGEGLHVGHPKGYIATDIYSRYKRMSGFNILHPMGWDAFGLPAENYALEQKIHPRVAVEKNIKRFKEQLSRIGFNYDWDREINTTDPEYYKWTQWIFLQLFKNGLAYQSDEPINWCPSCKTGLANEDLENGKCERCGSIIEQKPIRQWVLKIREYADRLLEDLDELEWPKSIKESQRNWIGRSEGTEIFFEVKTKTNYVLLHGFKSSPERHFLPWLKKELESRGYNVQVPSLPNTKKPDIEEQTRFVLENVSFDENTILFGHSLGTVVAMKVVEQLEKPIEGLVLAGPFIDIKRRDGRQPRAYDKTFQWRFDFEKIKSNTGFSAVLAAKNDTSIPLDTARRVHDALGGSYKEVVAQDNHFTAEQEPIILDALRLAMKVFTTRPDTLFGAMYLVLSPEHKQIPNYKSQITNWDEVKAYIEKSKKKTEIERVAKGKDPSTGSTSSLQAGRGQGKTGVELKGIKAINPATKEEIPVWIADYVLVQYGTGAIMAVPAHDERDFAFAREFKLPIVEVITGGDIAKEAYTGEGSMINSGKFDGMKSTEARDAISEYVGGEKRVTYKLRDWVFSRQRYWGEPIPIIHCEKCGAVPVQEEDLPVLLPDVKAYEPTGTGESPLANIKEWVNAKCPKCGGRARRETNTMPQWAGSSWYYLRYIDPHNKQDLVDKTKEKYWSPVDVYIGGTEHATRHLIYARFWHKFLYDIGVVHHKEPFTQLRNQGLIYGEDGRKMSKRWGNVINPDDMIERFGADTLRLYEMFMGPFEDTICWSTDSMVGAYRFLDRVWGLQKKSKYGIVLNTGDIGQEALFHKTIQKISGDIEGFHFNTAISSMMIFVKTLDKKTVIPQNVYEVFLKLLAPFAPYITEELWHVLGHKSSIHEEEWPHYDESKTRQATVCIVIQVNGKVRDNIEVTVDSREEWLREKVMTREKVRKWITGKKIEKVVYIKNRLLNLVTN